MKKELFLRTDVLPGEIPILFSNKTVYLNFSKKNFEINKEVKNMLKTVTVPYFYYIPKSDKAERKIGLVHPIAQLQMFNYILTYENLITSFCKNSPYSVRSPIKRNIPKIKEQEKRAKEIKKIEEEFSFTEKISVTSEEDKILFHNYFSYKKYTRPKELYDSPKFNRDKYKYSYFLKLDIQRCFPSIYTHSLAWAIFGNKALGKKYTGASFDNIFPNASDIISQKINFNETHGLLVGPEFSRVIAELLLTRVDVDLQVKLRDNELRNKKNYSLYRYVDDYFLFSHNKEDAVFIERALADELNKYNLNLNHEKSRLQEKPFEISGGEILELKIILKQFNQDKKLSYDIKKEQKNANIQFFSEYKGSMSQWNVMFNRVEDLVIRYPHSKTKIVNYFLKSIRSSIYYDGEHNKIVSNILEVVSNIYILDANSNSTNYLISIYVKLLNWVKKDKTTSKFKLEEENTEENKRILEQSKTNLIFIEEKIFQHSYRILKNKLNNIEQLYDLIVFMKLLDKKLSAAFLSEILSLYKNSYFVCCAIAYYILDDKQEGLDMSFKTVGIKMLSVIEEKINNYESKGALDIILEGEYFYYLNDFSKYPGFQPSKQKKLSQKLCKAYTHYCSKSNIETNIWEKITEGSYFQWNTSMESFVRKVVKKSSNTELNSKAEY